MSEDSDNTFGMEKHAGGGDDYNPEDDPGCRPCCSAPYGANSVATAAVATVAWALALTTLNSCHYLNAHFTYCHPPEAQAAAYGTCGDCHCINLDKPCPSGEANVPRTDYPKNFTAQLNAMKPTNQMQMACNPYNATDKGNRTSCTEPPQDLYQVELWETAVCGIKYDMDKLTQDLCPTEYNMTTYNSSQDMLDDGAIMTHWGACGVCSTTQDLATYIDNPDLTGKGQECGIRGLFNVDDGIKCFEEAGYTTPCAEMWMYNVFNTRDHCFDICIDFTFFGDGKNSGPPPECRIANCLLCDEEMSGPIFQTEAARSRRRSGLLSKIPRHCENILIVNHTDPCEITRAEVARRESERERRELEERQLQQGWFRRKLQQWEGLSSVLQTQRPTAPPKWTPPEPRETCVYVKLDIGLLSYAGLTSNNWFDGLFLSAEDKKYKTLYNTCYKMDLRNSVTGYWYYMKDILGGMHAAAKAFAIIAVVVGFFTMMFAWTTLCSAWAPKFWFGLGLCFALCSLSNFLTLLYFGSGVCELGCTFEAGAAVAIVAGVLWAVCAFLSFRIGPYRNGMGKANCCCCPTSEKRTGAHTAAYLPIPTASDPPSRTEVSVTETEQSDGTVVVEKVTTLPNGGKTVEVTTTKKMIGSKMTEADESVESEVEKPVKAEQAAFEEEAIDA
uniref:Uncharacterized protein n=1 Tax=Pseudictyota dubia TaxID=2749911 RepID=A0A7R9W9P1_9STRA|mmetsp:Transcript_38568/g.71281  ORF Transcript_38568/g.71281 Transcript_38568/m.71281 type:complete len:671 (+) Transcript_38568:73-2085(+)|eukprot:CAMPEP_0197439418 /NCGR_PEP_ID=MMETSP1175-20131217/6171_1 /TAXON_ID=1003142 /ORGANISM="Triceratium dubium, Strain CCMP147" /LENGTH=670 /DNA_ID=CAMNT_0042969333 /DNA_START=73 /DNA_END=2085 /DNA_ORIENTATION=-